jgi:hypothetical protein
MSQPYFISAIDAKVEFGALVQRCQLQPIVDNEPLCLEPRRDTNDIEVLCLDSLGCMMCEQPIIDTCFITNSAKWAPT